MDPPALSSSRLFLRKDMEAAEINWIATGEVAAFSSRSPQKKTDNEDAAVLIPLDEVTGVLAVADGVGGHAGGAEASGLTVKKLQQAVEKAFREKQKIRLGILDGFEAANQAVMEMGVGAATTLSVLEIQEDWVRSYHVGDSLTLIVGQKGKFKFQTISHSPVGYAVEAGLMNEKEAMTHEESHVVSNVIGSPEMRIEIGPKIKLQSRDTAVLATDGLSDNLTSSEISDVIRKGKLTDLMGTLNEKCKQRMLQPREGQPSKPDDLTFVVFRAVKRVR